MLRFDYGRSFGVQGAPFACTSVARQLVGGIELLRNFTRRYADHRLGSLWYDKCDIHSNEAAQTQSNPITQRRKTGPKTSTFTQQHGQKAVQGHLVREPIGFWLGAAIGFIPDGGATPDFGPLQGLASIIIDLVGGLRETRPIASESNPLPCFMYRMHKRRQRLKLQPNDDEKNRHIRSDHIVIVIARAAILLVTVGTDLGRHTFGSGTCSSSVALVPALFSTKGSIRRD